jgi:hypothetical protein
MYWIIFSFITLVTVFFIIGFIITVKDDTGGDTSGNLFIAACVCGLIMWAFIENKTYTTSSPKEIKPKDISILKDKEVAILRYKTFQENFSIKKEYDAISDSTFVLQETTEYNIQGEENVVTYKLVTK